METNAVYYKKIYIMGAKPLLSLNRCGWKIFCWKNDQIILHTILMYMKYLSTFFSVVISKFIVSRYQKFTRFHLQYFSNTKNFGKIEEKVSDL